MRAQIKRLKKAVRRVKRVVRKAVKRIEVPREDVWERPYPDEVAGWETKGRYRNSGESPMKGEKSYRMIKRLGKKPKKRKAIVYTVAYLQASLPPLLQDIVRDDRIEPKD